MNRRRRPRPQVHQPTPEDLLTQLLDFIQTHFYAGHAVAFAKDKPRLLDWVILRFARWLEDRAVTISTTRYLEIVREKILMDALRHTDFSKVTYLPAFLSKCVETHLDHHGEEYYDEAKSLRNLVASAVHLAGHYAKQTPDPISTLAATSRCLRAARKTRPVKTRQLDLL